SARRAVDGGPVRDPRVRPDPARASLHFARGVLSAARGRVAVAPSERTLRPRDPSPSARRAVDPRGVGRRRPRVRRVAQRRTGDHELRAPAVRREPDRALREQGRGDRWTKRGRARRCEGAVARADVRPQGRRHAPREPAGRRRARAPSRHARLLLVANAGRGAPPDARSIPGDPRARAPQPGTRRPAAALASGHPARASRRLRPVCALAQLSAPRRTFLGGYTPTRGRTRPGESASCTLRRATPCACARKPSTSRRGRPTRALRGAGGYAPYTLSRS